MNKSFLKIFSGILLAILTIALPVIWDLELKENISGLEVVVVAKDLDRQEQITEEHVTIKRVEKSSLVDNYILPKDKEKVIGYYSKTMIQKNSVLSNEYIDYDDILPDPNNNEAIRPLPQDWIYALPGSLRRKDKADFYLVKETEGRSSDDSQLGSEAEEGVSFPDVKENHEISKAEFEMIQNGEIPLLKDVPIVYIKDSSNQEILDTKGKKDRYNATGNLSNLEVNLNNKDMALLGTFIHEGYKILITYN